jgi:hypothetical protein
LQLCNLEGLAAADVGAGELVVAAHHIGLRLGKAGSIALVGSAGQLRTLAPHYPGDLVLARLAALGAREGVGSQFRGLVEKIPFFHRVSASGSFHLTDKNPSAGTPLFHSGPIYSILMLAMKKRKPGRFSATKAVKANARERVGQPKPARVLAIEPRTGREAKHKPKMEEIIRQEE